MRRYELQLLVEGIKLQRWDAPSSKMPISLVLKLCKALFREISYWL